MNNTVRSAVIICGDGTRPESNDPKTYQQNPPQPTSPYHSTHCIVPLNPLHRSAQPSASSRPRYSPSPIHHLRLFIAIFRLSHFPLFAMFPPFSPVISSPLVPTHSLLFSPTLPSLSSFSLSFQCPIPHPFIPLPAPFHSPSHILSFPFPLPFIPIPSSFHLPYLILSFPFPHPFISLPASPPFKPQATSYKYDHHD
jgi:hypothetical protein